VPSLGVLIRAVKEKLAGLAKLGQQRLVG